MAAFCAVNRLSASAPVMFLGAMPSLITSLDHWSTAPTVPADESMDLVASALVTPPPFSHISTGHMGMVLFSARAIPYCGDLPPLDSLTASDCHWVQVVGGPDRPALANRVLFQYSIIGAKFTGTP